MRLAQPRTWRAIAVLALLTQTSLSAHVVVVEQIVEMTTRLQPDGIVVHLHVPASITGDPSLPGLLAGRDREALERQLQIVAADIARNLDVQQGETTLPLAAAIATRADAASIDVEVRYAAPSDSRALSARLNAFSAKDGPVRTHVRFLPASGGEQTLSVIGPAARVAFDPPLASVLTSFALRGLRALFDGGDQLLFLVCILLPTRRPTALVALYAAAAFGQAVTIAASAVSPAIADASAVALVAASTIAIAAMQNVAGARVRWVLPLVVGFGVLNGWTLGTAGQASWQFAGAHQTMAMVAFVSVLLLGELWLGAVAWAFRTWLHERGVSDRMLILLGSAMLIHGGVHRMMERAQTAPFGGERAILWLTLGWVGAVLLAAAANALTNPPARAHAS